MSNRFWVIGGEYTDTRFSQLIDGTEQMFGPLGPYRQRDPQHLYGALYHRAGRRCGLTDQLGNRRLNPWRLGAFLDLRSDKA